jgi:hypothetical protein
LPDVFLKDVIRQATAERGVNHDGEEDRGEEDYSEEGEASSFVSA